MEKIKNQFICSMMMLPQHKEVVEVVKQQEGKIKMPVLDEQLLEEFNCLIKKSLEKRVKLRIEFFSAGQNWMVEGVVTGVAGGNAIIKTHKSIEKVSLKQVIGVQEIYPGEG